MPAAVHEYWRIYLISGDLCLTDEKGSKIKVRCPGVRMPASR
jgi:hypothetical protein